MANSPLFPNQKPLSSSAPNAAQTSAPNAAQSTEDLVAELMKRGASMEQVAQLKNSRADSPADALSALKAGNTRFYNDKPERVFADVNHRRAQIMTQTPFAVILGCSDSRVPVEIIFDQGPGDIFSIRVAGTVAEASTLGSIQYAIAHLKVHLVVVLGHEGCGAVAAAMQDSYTRAKEPGHVRFLLEKIEPAVRDLPLIKDHKARMREAVVANVRHQKLEVERDAIVAEAVASGKVRVVGAFYEIGSGAVDFLED